MCEIVNVRQVEQLESQNRQVRKDFKEMKIREARTMSDYSELEEENVLLQKQLAGLKQTQVSLIISSSSSSHGIPYSLLCPPLIASSPDWLPSSMQTRG